jgi:hypothetical protein
VQVKSKMVCTVGSGIATIAWAFAMWGVGWLIWLCVEYFWHIPQLPFWACIVIVGPLIWLIVDPICRLYRKFYGACRSARGLK